MCSTGVRPCWTPADRFSSDCPYGANRDGTMAVMETGDQTRWVLDEDDALDLLAFLVTSARTQVDEAREYGPLRLLMAAHRLADAMSPRSGAETRTLIAQDLATMPVIALPTDGGAADYVARLDELCAAVARLVTDRYASDDES